LNSRSLARCLKDRILPDGNRSFFFRRPSWLCSIVKGHPIIRPFLYRPLPSWQAHVKCPPFILPVMSSPSFFSSILLGIVWSWYLPQHYLSFFQLAVPYTPSQFPFCNPSGRVFFPAFLPYITFNCSCFPFGGNRSCFPPISPMNFVLLSVESGPSFFPSMMRSSPLIPFLDDAAKD